MDLYFPCTGIRIFGKFFPKSESIKEGYLSLVRVRWASINRSEYNFNSMRYLHAIL